LKPAPEAGRTTAAAHALRPSPIARVSPERALPTPVPVSVICPTFNRHDMHPQLYRVFKHQEYPHKDLWVLDDSPTSSPFFASCSDPAVHYVHSPQRQTIGNKRNRLIALSAGSVIAHFDDDDVYAPCYLASMLAALVGKDADFVKLSMWNERRTRDNRTRTYDGRHNVHANTWGWGFSYVYRRFVASRVSFPNMNLGEDYAFVQALQARGLKSALVDNGSNWIEHIIHGRNVSRKE